MIMFRCDAGPVVGAGHVTRCRELARVLKSRGARSIMVGPDERYSTPGDADVFDAWIARPDWESSETDARSFVRDAQDQDARVAVMDDYRVDAAYQAVLRQSGLRWMQQFDASKPQDFWADLVVNASPYETDALHAHEIMKPGAKGLFGPLYAIMRPEFPPAERPAARPVDRVLVTFGGGDDKGCVVLSLSALLERLADPIRFVVVSGPNNPRNAENAAWIDASGAGRVTLAINPPDVAATYAACDLAILAAGTTGHEVASCGVPMLLVAMADNQVRQGTGWQTLGAGVFLGRAGELRADDLAERVAALVGDGETRSEMARTGRRLVDGRGVHRLADHLLGLDGS